VTLLKKGTNKCRKTGKIGDIIKMNQIALGKAEKSVIVL
jgi:hypothetical protein